MNDQSKIIDQEGAEVLDPRKALSEPTLAVDLARAEIDQAIATAHKFPRIIDTAIKKISTLALYNKDSAENCIYALPRGGKPIIGPSIGFANIVAQAWGNCRSASRIVYIDRPQKVVIAEGAFVDLESNATSIVPVQRRIVDKSGRIYNDDMIMVTGMAAASIARRNAILQGVSRGMWFPIYTEALGIVRGTVETFAEYKDKAFKALMQFGIKPEQVVLYLGLKGDVDLTFEHIPMMRGMYAALRDGSVTVEEMFDPRRLTGKGFETVDNPLGDDVGVAAQNDGGDDQAPAAAAADPKPQQAKAEPVQQQTTMPLDSKPKEEAKSAAAGDKKPSSFDEYRVHWLSFCKGATSVTAVKNQYSAERALRGECGQFNEQQVEELVSIRDERVRELQK